ncbi:hypothetical protein AMTRI_Chr06g171090 [Amborella trichopoda]
MSEITRQSIWFLGIILLSFGHGVKGRRTSLGYKNAAQTIHSLGDVFDRIDIYKQPAFDHPLLKNHTIQMRPSWYPKEASAEPKISREESVVSSVRNKFEECPKGTIPIYFYRAIQKSSVWIPQLEIPIELSAVSTGLINSAGTEMVGVGWIVHPSFCGDSLTRLFISWMIVGSQDTGCYNFLCPGFIQTNPMAGLGAIIATVSVIGGQVYHVNSNIRDVNTGNRWFIFQGFPIDYWPESIFTNFNVHRTVVWTGQVLITNSYGYHTSTQMGNGLFRVELQDAAYFKNLQVVDIDGKWPRPIGIVAFQDNNGCLDTREIKFSMTTGFNFGG